MTVAGNLLAKPLHISGPSAHFHGKSVCVFPDGSSPVQSPNQHCYSPDEFLKAYGIDKLHANGITGKGQTIIFADSFGSPTLQSDLDHFSDTYNLPKTTIQFIYPNGPYTNTLANDDEKGWAEETTLDAEWAHVIAPDATLVNIVTSSSETTAMNGLQDLFDGFKIATTQYPNAIISMSFATGEATFSSTEISTYVQGSLHKILQDATDAGITLVAGAGDWGTASINTDQTAMYAFPTVSYPSSDPLVTSVGGTSVQANWKWNPQGTAEDYWKCQLAGLSVCPNNFLNASENTGGTVEMVWKEDWALAGGGGGISTVFKSPDFQSVLNSDVQNLVKGFRAVPDLSFNASINGGVAVYESYGTTGAPPTWQAVGGTSAATPEIAGLVALAGQEASNRLGKTVGIGNLNKLIYALSSQDFNDVVPQTIGTQNQVVLDSNALFFDVDVLNAVGPTHMPPSAVTGYSVTEGYDLATGLGTPRGEAFVMDLAAARAAQGW